MAREREGRKTGELFVSLVEKPISRAGEEPAEFFQRRTPTEMIRDALKYIAERERNPLFRWHFKTKKSVLLPKKGDFPMRASAVVWTAVFLCAATICTASEPKQICEKVAGAMETATKTLHVGRQAPKALEEFRKENKITSQDAAIQSFFKLIGDGEAGQRYNSLRPTERTRFFDGCYGLEFILFWEKEESDLRSLVMSHEERIDALHAARFFWSDASFPGWSDTIFPGLPIKGKAVKIYKRIRAKLLKNLLPPRELLTLTEKSGSKTVGQIVEFRYDKASKANVVIVQTDKGEVTIPTRNLTAEAKREAIKEATDRRKAIENADVTFSRAENRRQAAIREGPYSEEEPIRSELPPEGSWVKYELSFTDLTITKELGNATSDVIVKTLGAEMHNGEKCRWFEVELKQMHRVLKRMPFVPVPYLRGYPVVISLLVAESGAQRVDQEVRIIRARAQYNIAPPQPNNPPPNNPPSNLIDVELDVNDENIKRGLLAMQAVMEVFNLLDDLLIEADPFPLPLGPQIAQFPSIQAYDHASGRNLKDELNQLPATALAIRKREERPIDTPKGKKDGYLVELSVYGAPPFVGVLKPRIELVPEVPFGIQSVCGIQQMPLGFGRQEDIANLPTLELGQIELKAIDYGDNAQSVLPNIP